MSEQTIELFFILLVPISAVGIYFIGKYIKEKHYTDIQTREQRFQNLPSVTGQRFIEADQVEQSWLVYGTVVVSGDNFMSMLAGLVKFFGGRIRSYESLLDRARREAVLRMKERAAEKRADMILNTRFENSKLDSMTASQKSNGMFEVLVYGTAVRFKVL